MGKVSTRQVLILEARNHIWLGQLKGNPLAVLFIRLNLGIPVESFFRGLGLLSENFSLIGWEIESAEHLALSQVSLQ